MWIFYTVQGTNRLILTWRREYNEVRPHSSLGYKPPAPATRIAIDTPLEQQILT
jgi:putative transposase